MMLGGDYLIPETIIKSNGPGPLEATPGGRKLSTGNGVNLTPAISRELDSLKADYPAKPAVRLAV